MKHVPYLANHCIGKERLIETMRCTDQPFRFHLTMFDGLFTSALASQDIYTGTLPVSFQLPQVADISGEGFAFPYRSLISN